MSHHVHDADINYKVRLRNPIHEKDACIPGATRDGGRHLCRRDHCTKAAIVDRVGQRVLHRVMWVNVSSQTGAVKQVPRVPVRQSSGSPVTAVVGVGSPHRRDGVVTLEETHKRSIFNRESLRVRDC